MKKTVPDNSNTLSAKSSRHPMMETNQGKTKINSYQKDEEPQFQNIPDISDKYYHKNLIEKKISYINRINKIVAQALALSNKQAYPQHNEALYLIDKLSQLKKYENNYPELKEIDKNFTVIGKVFANNLLKKKNYMPDVITSANVIISIPKHKNSFYNQKPPFHNLRVKLKMTCKKELKNFDQQNYPSNSIFNKCMKYISNCFIFIRKFYTEGHHLKTVRSTAEWYETEGQKVHLNNSDLDQNVREWIEFSKECSEFLKQENIQ